MDFNKGSVLLEAVIGVSVIVIFISSLVLVHQILIVNSSVSIGKTQASLLAEEGIEVIKYLRDKDWDSQFNFGSGCLPVEKRGPYGLAWDQEWATTTPGAFIDGKFLRTVEIENVCRDNSSFDIASSGTFDPNTKKVTVSVSWLSNEATTTRTMSTYITNIHYGE